ncbi:MAG: aminotransferase class I/II-fold pyridoxal phosphate-dependent enzyme [Gemmatimonadaceae bacterium]
MNETRLLPDDAREAGAQTFVDVLEYRAAREPSRTIFRYIHSDGHEQASITFAELRQRARAIAAGLSEHVVPGDRVVVLVPPGLDYIAAFFGCLYAGAVAVPAYPPNPRRADTRVARMVADCDARVAIVSGAFMARLESWLTLTPELGAVTWLDVTRLLTCGALTLPDPPVVTSSLAMLQYTSGSTGEPRGVMLSHANLLHNSVVVHRVTEHEENDGAVFWLPPFHDMGLIGGILQPIYASVPTSLMAPATFLQRPFRWLEAISRCRATTSGAPNFAYDLCVERIGEDERRTLDLSAWRTSFNGAEPVRADTLTRFVEAFSPCGLRSDLFVPCYGLAEGTLLVSGGRTTRAHVVIADRVRLESGELRAAATSDANAVALVAAGAPATEVTVAIVDPDSCVPCVDGQVGEIWTAGGSVGMGYWNRADATAAAFRARLAGSGPASRTFLRTGDLGVIADGQLIITGRLKDLVILDGRNYYPHDIEVAAERSNENLRPGFTAAFSVEDGGRERLVLVAEVGRQHKEQTFGSLFHAVRTGLASTVGVVPDEIVLIRQRTIPRTSSGKIQRRACRAAYLSGLLDVVARWRAPGSDVPPMADAIEAFVLDWLRDELFIDATRANSRATLRDLGVDSIAATRLLVALEGQLGRPIDAAQLWSQPDIGALAHFLAAGESRATAATPAGPRRRYGTPTAASTDVAQWAEYRTLRERLEMLAANGAANPFFRVHDGVATSATSIDGRPLVSFANYNYLGLSGDPDVTRAAQDSIARWGTSVSASRVVSGERAVHLDLEAEIAAFVGTDDAIAYIGGHPTNVSTISHLLGPDDIVFCDALLHNSAMQGAEFSGARRLVFPHNDWAALDDMLTRSRAQHRRAMVVIEGVYSADGDTPDLARFVDVKARHHAMLMVDEAHSLGVLGATGRGLAEHAGVNPRRVEIWMGTLSKSLGSVGGYIAGSAALVKYLKYTAPGFVYSVGMAPANAAAALAALRKLRAEPQRVARLRDRADRFRALCAEAGIVIGDGSGTPVVPVIVGDSVRAAKLSELLLDLGYDVQPMLAPSVPEDQARLRFFITALHTDGQLRGAVAALADALTAVAAIAAVAAVAVRDEARLPARG